MEIESVAIRSIKPLAGNPRVHGERNRDAIRASLDQHGQYAPLVVRRDTREILVGNGRWQEMRTLGWEECDVLFVDVTDAQAKALVLLDNRSSELSEWNDDFLAEMFRDLQSFGVDVSDLGWNASEIEKVINDAAGGLEDKPEMAAIKLTREQYEVVKEAIDRIRRKEGDQSISDGRCLELVCLDFLSDPNYQ